MRKQKKANYSIWRNVLERKHTQNSVSTKTNKNPHFWAHGDWINTSSLLRRMRSRALFDRPPGTV